MPSATSTLARRGPNTNATCETGYQWTENAAELSPCLVAAAIVGGCGGSDYTVPALTAGSHYNPPGINGQPINGCSWKSPKFTGFWTNLCSSWAAYNMYSSCTACQGLDSSIRTWVEFRASCDTTLPTS
ncbi:hypothetical protein C8J55DRAFT_87931 [Lentinula edodes]|uniref:Uncharacterized protein n=1 Tax=Lentinula lateritia TaxID=40482 RepID=A0A9W9A9N8_9AGAR|nr:hypothetical protein C8J55DRAFT_87931 [Lentinula edodes]